MNILDTGMGAALLTAGVASVVTILFGGGYYLFKGRRFRLSSDMANTKDECKTMKKRIYLVTVMLLLGMGGTYFGRSMPSLRSFTGLPYPATTLAVVLALSGGGIFQTGDCNNAPMWAKVVGWSVIAPISLAAIPGVLVIDTILLPLDLYREEGIYRMIKRTTEKPNSTTEEAQPHYGRDGGTRATK